MNQKIYMFFNKIHTHFFSRKKFFVKGCFLTKNLHSTRFRSGGFPPRFFTFSDGAPPTLGSSPSWLSHIEKVMYPQRLKTYFLHCERNMIVNEGFSLYFILYLGIGYLVYCFYHARVSSFNYFCFLTFSFILSWHIYSPIITT